MSTPSAIAHEHLSVLEVAEEWHMEQLLRDTQATACIALRIAPTVAIVRSGQIDKLMTRLRKLGHTPKREQR